MASWPQKVLLSLASLGRGLRVNTGTNQVDVFLSADSGQQIVYSPNDGGLLLTNQSVQSAALPAVTTADVGDTLAVNSQGQWAKNPYFGPIQNWPALV